MKVSELIKELENILNNYGDLDVVKGKNYVGSEEVTGVAMIRGHQCYIENKYLDNWAIKNTDKLDWVKKDLSKYLTGLSCSQCRHHKDGYCYWNRKNINDEELNIECFDGEDLPYEVRYKIRMMQNCIHKLNYELKQGNEW